MCGETHARQCGVPAGLRAKPPCLTLCGVWCKTGDELRELAPSEQRFVRHATFTGRSVAVAGVLDIAALRTAFADLRRAHPILACRIGENAAGAGVLLRPAGPGVEAGVRAGAVAEPRLPAGRIDPTVQLAYLDVVTDGELARVTLYAHHAIADAGHCVALLRRLWERYSDLVCGIATEVVPQGFPCPLEWYAGQYGVTRAGVSGLEEASVDRVACPFPPDPAVPAPPALYRPARIVLDAEHTARLTERAREGGGVNGLVTAALMRAYAAEIGYGAGESVVLSCVYPVDMRARLQPPVAAADGTNMAGLTAFTAEIDPTTDPVDLGVRVTARLHHDLAEGIVAQSVLHFPDYYGPAATRAMPGHVAVTNTGRVPLLRTPPGLTITDYEIVYLSAHPRPSTGPSAAVTFLVYSFASRLTIGVLGGGAHLPAAVERELSALTAFSVDV